jgi:iron complex outermembrane receptor protein
MMGTHTLRHLAVTIGLCSAFAMLTVANAQTESASSAESGQLQEILVTANKRQEPLQNVPITVNVLSSEQLEEQGAMQLADYAKQVPAMNIIGAGGPGLGEIVLRGITTGSDHSSPVAIYLNDVPFTPSSPIALTSGLSFDPDLASIAQIEVLEGPQSTIWGASAEGGVVKFVTEQPNLNVVKGNYSVTGSDVYNGGTGGAFRGSINLPIVPDSVALLASVSYRNDPGFVDNTANGSKNVNWDSVRGGSILLRVKISDNLETTIMGLAQDIDQPGPNQVFLNPTTLRPALGRLAYDSPVAQPSDSIYRTIADTTTYTMPFAQLTNVASYVKFANVSTVDFSFVAPFVAGLPAGDLVNFANTSSSERYTDELRLASNPGRIEYLAGLFYTNERDDNIEIDTALNPDASTTPVTAPYHNVYNANFVPYFIEKAVYGNLTYNFTDKISLTGGARYSANTQSVYWYSTGAFGVNNVPSYSASDHAITYLATLKYIPNPDLTTYVRASSAYRPGGPNVLNSLEIAGGAQTSYKSDLLWNYEAGVKGAAWDHRLTYTAAAYHMVWSNIQLTESIHNFIVVANGSGARSDGAEATVQIEPIDRFTIGLRGAYTDARFTAAAPQLGAVSGNPLPYAPKTSLAAIMDYHFATVGSVTPTVGLTYAYHGADESSYSNGVTYHIPHYETLDFRTGLDWSQYSVIFRVMNLTNEYGLTSVYIGDEAGDHTVGTVIQPRTFQLSLNARF